MATKSLRSYVARSMARGLVLWVLVGIALATRELLIFHPNLLGGV